jgi:hypothetical protein
MNRSPTGEETLVFIGYMHLSKANGSQMVDLQRDAFATTGVAADQLDLVRASGKRDDWPQPWPPRRLPSTRAMGQGNECWTARCLTRYLC